jgi:hypothetical protein
MGKIASFYCEIWWCMKQPQDFERSDNLRMLLPLVTQHVTSSDDDVDVYEKVFLN